MTDSRNEAVDAIETECITQKARSLPDLAPPRGMLELVAKGWVSREDMGVFTFLKSWALRIYYTNAPFFETGLTRMQVWRLST